LLYDENRLQILEMLRSGEKSKIPMLTFEAANLGFTFTLIRLALSVIGILIIAIITEKSLDKDQQERIYTMNQAE